MGISAGEMGTISLRRICSCKWGLTLSSAAPVRGRPDDLLVAYFKFLYFPCSKK